jgi:iron complex transport system ATP-binding protein
MSFFCVHDLSAGYTKKHIVRNVCFSLETGSVMGILGANGSGKTTLIKAICGILPHEGTCLLEEAKLEALSARQIAKLVSYIPQRSGIAIDISALDVVLMGFNPRLGLLEHPDRAMIQAAQKALEQVGLGGKEQTNYLHLSEGQKQLCILARTLVCDSKLFVLDEPESALDHRFRYQMLSVLRDRVASGKSGAIVTLHDPGLALDLCDELLLLSDGGVLGVIRPGTDPLDEMERMLSQVYGPISLHRCHDRKGKAHIVMLREDQV